MRDGPPSAADNFATIGLGLAGVGAVGMVAGALLNAPAVFVLSWSGVMFVGIFILEVVWRLWA